MNKFFRILVSTIIISVLFSTTVFAAGEGIQDQAIKGQNAVTLYLDNDNTLNIETNDKAFCDIPYIWNNGRVLLKASTIQEVINDIAGNENACMLTDLCSKDSPMTRIGYNDVILNYIADIQNVIVSNTKDTTMNLDCSPVWSRTINKNIVTSQFFRNGSMYIPVSATFENFGFTVTWNGKDKSITIVRKD